MNGFDLIHAVAFALREAGSPYAWGATGRLCTPAYRESLARQYPAQAGRMRAACPALRGGTCAACKYAGRRVYDCAQFVRRALQTCGIALPSGASSQWLRGPWALREALPRPMPGAHYAMENPCVLFRAQGVPGRPMAHVGLSLGDGRAADARGSGAGVVVMSIAKYPWTHFAVPVGTPGAVPAVAYGARGETVRRLQRALLALGFALPRFGADGVFGKETQGALDAARRAGGMAEEEPCGQDALVALERLAAERTGKDG